MNKSYYLKKHKYEIKQQLKSVSKFYTSPHCIACGSIAAIISVPDGGCGDPECCPQTSHAELLCINKNCPTLMERL